MHESEGALEVDLVSRRARQRDRRRGLGDVLATLARTIGSASDGGSLRSAFEEALARTLPVQAVALRDCGGRWRPDDRRGTADGVAFDVVGPSPGQRGILEATFERGRRLGEWDFQLMGHAAHLASVVLEAERARSATRAVPVVSPRASRSGPVPLVGTSPVMAALRDRIDRVAQTDFTVLLEGESGVGKELVARQIHERSRRRNGPFVAVNCAALVETLLEAELFGIEERTATGVRGRRGKFEHADGGTLFLDEVSDLSLTAQAKLLRAIQEMAVERVGGAGAQRVDIRIVAATNRGLSDMVARRLFRPDLFYRLGGVDIRVPSLRERRSDVAELCRHFLDQHRGLRAVELSASALDALLLYDWPGNVRELERLIERVVALATSEVIDLDDLPAPVRGDYAAVLGPSLARSESMRAWGSRYARLVFERCAGNKRETARALGISYHTLNAYLRFRPSDVRPDEAFDEAEVGLAGDDTSREAPIGA